MRVFIAEKPSVAKAISESLGIKSRKDGYYECKDGTIVTNCFGHLLERAEPDSYLDDSVPVSPKTNKKVWRRQDLPIIPIKWKKLVSSDKRKQIKIIKELLKTATEVVNAGDPDREGQLLVDEVIAYCEYKGNVTRYWQSAMDATSVSRALKAIVPNSQYYNWGLSAEARGCADWLIGMNFSRQLTLKHKNGLISVGRVQSPVLKIVVDRDLAIENFKSKTFFNVESNFLNQDTNFNYIGKLDLPEDLFDAEGQLTDKAKAQKLIDILNSNPKGNVTKFTVTDKKTLPKLLYTLADLQVECSSLFGFSAKKTLDIAQKLYETYKLTTYPRSSCEYLPKAQIDDVRTILGYLKVGLPEFTTHLNRAINIENNRVFNDQKVNESAHTGLAPTPKAISEDEITTLEPECKKVYMLIIKRYISCFMPPYLYKESNIETKVNDFLFKTTLKQPISLGFKALDKDENEEPTVKNIPSIQINSLSVITKTNLTEAMTKPPKYFTEGTLIQAMRNVAKFIDDKEEKKTLKETDGIGTEATRAQILETLKHHGYLEVGKSGKTKGKIISSLKGREIIKVIPKHLQSPALTAKEEENLRLIQTGKLSLSNFLNAKAKEIQTTMSEIDNSQTQMNNTNSSGNEEKCPKCGAKLYRNESQKKKGLFYWHCSNKECGIFLDDVNGKPQIRKEHPCPKCGQNLRRFESNYTKGVYTWLCFNENCKARFNDNKGEVGAFIQPKDTSSYITCPECHKEHAVHRCESKKAKGKFFWVCSKCNSFFGDNEGKIGNKFSTN